MVEGRLEPSVIEAVEAHVDICSDCRRLLAAVARTDEPRGVAEGEGGFVPGETAGRYLILHRVGAGGMGEVYAAWDPELDRKIALKVVTDVHSEEPGAQDRLLREAKAMAAISHPHVISVYDVGRLDARVYLAMEYMDGGTLRSWLRCSPRPRWPAVVRRFLDAGEGLVAAHEVGLIHRDFKPDNVLVGAGERVYVTDFGLARAAMPTEPALVLDERDTQTRTAGTFAYAAPEQLVGDPIATHVDQFGFCVALWEGLYGVLPFEGQTPEVRLDAIRVGPGRVPSDSAVPAAVRRVLARGLAFAPVDRYPTLSDLLADLRRAAAPRRGLVWVAAGVALVALSTGAWALGSGEPAECDDGRSTWEPAWGGAARDQLRGEFEATGSSYARSTFEHFERQIDDYAEAWAGAYRAACVVGREPAHRESARARQACLERHRAQAFDLLDAMRKPDRLRMQRAVPEALRLPPVQECERPSTSSGPDDPRLAELRAEVETLSRLRRLGRIDEARPRMEAALERATALEADGLRALLSMNLGFIDSDAARLDQAQARLVESSLLALRAARPELAIKAYVGLMAVDGDRGRPEWVSHWEAMAGALLPRLGEASRYHSDLANAQAYAKLREGDLYGARVAFEEAVALSEQTLGVDHLDTLESRSMLAFVYSQLGQLDEALAIQRSVLAKQIDILGQVHRDVAASMRDIGTTLEQMSRTDEALESYEQSVALFIQIYGERHPSVATTWGNMAIALVRRDASRARSLLERAREILREVYEPSHPKSWILSHHLGRALARMGEHAQARALWDELLQTMGDAAQTHALGPRIYLGLGRSLGQLGEYEAARAWLRRAADLAALLHGEGHVETMYPVVEEGLISILEGKPDLALLERVVAFDARTSLQSYGIRARFYLAQALVARGGDHPRALQLAMDAHASVVEHDPQLAKQIDAWLDVHRR